MSNDKPVIFFEEGIPKTTSLEVARIFGKSHFHVMRDIRELDIPDHFRRSNFGLIEIIEENANGMKIDKSYFKIARDGYNLLIMGYRGKNAMHHKLAFIEAFNMLEGEVERIRVEQGQGQHRNILDVQQPQIEETFRCARCRGWFPRRAFDRDNTRAEKRQSWCKQCHDDRRLELKGQEPQISSIPKPPVTSMAVIPSTKDYVFSRFTNPPMIDQKCFGLIVKAAPKAGSEIKPGALDDLLKINQDLLALIGRILKDPDYAKT